MFLNVAANFIDCLKTSPLWKRGARGDLMNKNPLLPPLFKGGFKKQLCFKS